MNNIKRRFLIIFHSRIIFLIVNLDLTEERVVAFQVNKNMKFEL